MIAKAECHDRGTNLRFTVTNRPGVLSAADGQRDYDHYTQRLVSSGWMNSRTALSMDPLTCRRFVASFFRLLLPWPP